VKTYEFDVILQGISEFTDDQTEALFESGCDDGTPVSCNGVAWVHFDREALSLEAAIHSAILQIRAAGLAVSKVELDVDATACLGA